MFLSEERDRLLLAMEKFKKCNLRTTFFKKRAHWQSSVYLGKKILFWITLGGVIGLLLLGAWSLKLNRDINTRLESGIFLPPLEIYISGFRFFNQQKISLRRAQSELQGSQFRKVPEKPNAQQYTLLSSEDCARALPARVKLSISKCLLFKTQQKQGLFSHILAFDKTFMLQMLFSGKPPVTVQQIKLPAKKLAQYYDGKPVLRTFLTIGDVPLQCLQAITAIEDQAFLDHKGVSLKGIIRSLWINIKALRYRQGASTLTQQLVKNYFLTPTRSLERKIQELIMAVLLEFKMTKDEIMQTYLNVIYMGQSGTYQIRGYSAAATYYFHKNLENLNLSECALLAAIINTPGRLSPFRGTGGAALKRRQKVLLTMKDSGFISDTEYAAAQNFPLPKTPNKINSEPSPYFISAMKTAFAKLKLNPNVGYKVYSTMNEDAQSLAHSTFKDALPLLQKKQKLPYRPP